MDFVLIASLKRIIALASVIFGIVALLRPQQTANAAFLGADTPRVAAEIRASWGGMFIGLGIAVILIGSYDAYLVFGIAYGLTALVRIVTWLMDSSIISRQAIIILVFEIVSAIVFVLPENLT